MVLRDIAFRFSTPYSGGQRCDAMPADEIPPQLARGRAALPTADPSGARVRRRGAPSAEPVPYRRRGTGASTEGSAAGGEGSRRSRSRRGAAPRVGATAPKKRRRAASSSPQRSFSDSESSTCPRRPRMDRNTPFSQEEQEYLMNLIRQGALQGFGPQQGAPIQGFGGLRSDHQAGAVPGVGGMSSGQQGWAGAVPSNTAPNMSTGDVDMPTQGGDMSQHGSHMSQQPFDMPIQGDDTSHHGAHMSSPPMATGEIRRVKKKSAGSSRAQPVNEVGRTRTKGPNFTPAEDKQLVLSWLEVNCDPMTNTGQNKETFWGKIVALYNSRCGAYPERTQRSLQSRWDKIKEVVLKYTSYYHKVVRRNPSGASDADKTAMAAADFAEFERTPFLYMHCWEIMKDSPKWMDPKHSRTRVIDLDGGEDKRGADVQGKGVDQSEEQSCPTPTWSGAKRPIGHDAAKGSCKKSSAASSSAGSDFANSMQGLLLSRMGAEEDTRKSRFGAIVDLKREQLEAQKQEDVLLELEKTKLQLMKEELAIRRECAKAESQKIALLMSQEEERLLGMDLNKIQEPLRSFYAKKQKEILASKEMSASKEMIA